MADTVTLPTTFVVTLYKALMTVEAAIDDYLGDDYGTAANALDALGREIDQACGAANNLEILVSQLTTGLLDAGIDFGPVGLQHP